MARVAIVGVCLIVALFVASTSTGDYGITGKEYQIAPYKSPNDYTDKLPGTPGSSDKDKGMFRPACKLDTSLQDRDKRSDNPAREYEFGLFQCRT